MTPLAGGRFLLGLGDPGRGALPLVMLPGIEGNPRCFQLLDELGRDRRAEAWPLPPGGSLPAMAAALLDQLEAPRIHLLGSSLGGLLAWELGLQAPERVASLVTLGSLPAPAARPRHIRWAASLVARSPRSLAGRAYRRRIRVRHAEEGVPAELSVALLAELPDRDILAARLRAVASWQPAGPPARPCLWLRGQVDQEAPWTAGEAARALPGVDVETVPGGHRAMLTHPRALAAVVRHFLAGAERAA